MTETRESQHADYIINSSQDQEKSDEQKAFLIDVAVDKDEAMMENVDSGACDVARGSSGSDIGDAQRSRFAVIPLHPQAPFTEELRASFLVFSVSIDKLSSIEGSDSLTSIDVGEKVISIKSERATCSFEIDSFCGVFPPSSRTAHDLIKDIKHIIISPTNTFIVRAEIYRSHEVSYVVFTFSFRLDLLNRLALLQKKRLDCICRIMRWASEDWEVYDDIRLNEGHNTYPHRMKYSPKESYVKNIFDLLSKITPPNM